MLPREFDYFAAKSVDETLSLLAKNPDETKILAGGQSLVPLMNLRLAAPKYIVDITRIPNLSYVRSENGGISIGPLTTHTAIEASPVLKQKCTLLSDAASAIGDPLVRNAGTIGGSSCHADPAAAYPPALLALNAEFKLVSQASQRTVTAEKFFVDVFTTETQSQEMLREISVPILDASQGSAYLQLSQRSGGLAIVAAAAVLKLKDANTCETVSIAVGGIGSKAIRLVEVENLLKGKQIDESTLKAVEAEAKRTVQPWSDVRASGEYRKDMVGVFVRRALRIARDRAKGES